MMDGDGRRRSEAAPVDGAGVLEAIAECLRHLANGYGLLPAERAACLRLLEAGIPGVADADFAPAMKILAASGRLTGRQREKASELALRLAAAAEASRVRPPCDRMPNQRIIR